MQRRVWQPLRMAILVALLVVLSAPHGAAYDFRGAFPQEQGELSLPGLRDRVEVWRDRQGIPHLYASSTHDLLLAQGFVHAQDRFWQMDVARHFAAGRMAELFGRRVVGLDRFVRAIGWSQSIPQDMTASGAEVVGLLSDYADGVNAYITTQRQQKNLLGYQVLRLTNADYQPPFWQPDNALLLGKALAWTLSDNLNDEIRRATLLRGMTPAQVEELFPPYPVDHPIIVEPGAEKSVTNSWSTAAKTAVAPPPLPSFVAAPPPIPTPALPLLAALARQLKDLREFLPPLQEGIGSNNWVIAGSRTATGKPLLASDPHLAVQIPSFWYEIGLHCVPRGPECPFEGVGFSYPGVPGLVLGHTDRIAWGLTNVGPDTMDLYIEKINPANPNQYEVNGRWVEMQRRTEQIRLAEGGSQTMTVRYTRHGPVVSDGVVAANLYDPQQFRAQYGTDLPERYAIALRWTALDPAPLGRAALEILKARNWQDFRRATQDFAYPSQNLVYADVDGNIGYQMPGRIPIRRTGDGRYPVPGWTDDYEWTGYIPFEALPSLYNPPQGYIASANNAVVGPGYPYLISSSWDYGFRAQRIQELIEGARHPLTREDMQRFQGDNKNLLAEMLVPLVLRVSLTNARQDNARRILQGWDFQENMDSPAAAFYNVWLKHLLQLTFQDEPSGMLGGGSRTAEILRRLVQQPDHTWWDDRQTPVKETRDEGFRRAIAAATTELETRLGRDPTRWRWGDLHTTTFTEFSLGRSGFHPIERLFNRGPFPTSGSGLTVNVSGWFPSVGYQVQWLPSMRMVVDLSNFGNSRSINSTGQSGHPRHPHYDDQIELWRLLQYHPMHWERGAIEAEGASRLVLLPQ